MNDEYIHNITRLCRKKGLTPTEVLIYSLCDEKQIAEQIFSEIAFNKKGDDKREEFNCCLEVLKRRGLIVY